MKFWFIVGLSSIYLSENVHIFNLPQLKMMALQIILFFIAASSILAGSVLTITLFLEKKHEEKYKKK